MFIAVGITGAAMESLSNRDYYLSRATDARARAEAARDPRVASIHIELAGKYEELAELVTEECRPPVADQADEAAAQPSLTL